MEALPSRAIGRHKPPPPLRLWQVLESDRGFRDTGCCMPPPPPLYGHLVPATASGTRFSLTCCLFAPQDPLLLDNRPQSPVRATLSPPSSAATQAPSGAGDHLSKEEEREIMCVSTQPPVGMTSEIRQWAQRQIARKEERTPKISVKAARNAEKRAKRKMTRKERAKLKKAARKAEMMRVKRLQQRCCAAAAVAVAVQAAVCFVGASDTTAAAALKPQQHLPLPLPEQKYAAEYISPSMACTSSLQGMRPPAGR